MIDPHPVLFAVFSSPLCIFLAKDTQFTKNMMATIGVKA